MSSLLQLNDANFDEFATNQEKTLLIAFSAPWCTTCRGVKPVIEELAAEHGEHLRVVEMNVEDSPKTASRFNVRVVPSLIVLRDGTAQQRIIGAKSKDKLRELLANFL